MNAETFQTTNELCSFRRWHKPCIFTGQRNVLLSFIIFQNLLKMKTFNIILIKCQRQWFKLKLQSFQVFHFMVSLPLNLFLFILIHQIADLLVHLAEEVNITVCSWVNSFILPKQVLKPCFKLVSLSNNS